MSALLDIRGLQVEAQGDAGWREIVHGIDLSIARGEVLGLIGESGAGKSTIGLAAMGVARAGSRISAGTIVFDGQNLLELGIRQRRRLRGARIAYIAQSAAAAFNPAYRLLAQCIEVPLRHGLMPRPVARAAAVELFRMTRLPDPDRIGERYPHQVSGGQLQRMMTAMAMVCRPDLIIFDEPTTALDVTTQLEVLGVIRRLVRDFGTAAIYVSHDIAVVSQIAHRICVLRAGTIVEQGDTASVVSAPGQDYTRALVDTRHLRKPGGVAEVASVPILEVRGVSASYGPQQVLFDLSFTVRQGQSLAIIGESGSGKTTAARLLAGLLPASAGAILWDGRRLPARYASRSRDDLRRIQYIYQMPDTALNPRHSVREIVGRPIAFYGDLPAPAQEERLRALLAMVELDPDTYIDRRPGELSGGQKQRVCIARALAAEPELLICDEVTSALDPLVAANLLALLARLQRELGLTYVFITHDISVARAIADTVLVMRRGRLVEAGTVDEILGTPHDPYTRRLLASVPELRPGWLDHALTESLSNQDSISREALDRG